MCELEARTFSSKLFIFGYKINFYDAVLGNKNITYLYTSSGTKLRQVTQEGNNITSMTDYCGSIIYTDSTLAFILMPEGRIVPDTLNFSYEYFIKDHLGNIRSIISETGEVLEENSYYSFGMQISALSYTKTTPLNKYLYNNKEFVADLGLEWYDYGARHYDAQIGRWHVVDPMEEEREWLTPYQYVQNNPIMMIDPDGMLDKVIPTSDEALTMIKNTLTEEDAQYVKLDENGNIDADLLKQAKSNSGNLADLKALVNDDKVYEVSVSSKFEYKTETGKLKTRDMGDIYYTDFMTGKPLEDAEGFKGVTQTPGNKANKYNSKDDVVRIHVNVGLNQRDRARTYSHEANGHATLFSEGKDHKHRVISTSNGFVDTNKELVKRINSAVNETEKNYDERYK